MQDKIVLSDQFEERLIEIAARIISLAGRLAHMPRLLLSDEN